MRAKFLGYSLIALWRTARVVLGLDVTSPWPGMMVVARLSQLFGLVALIFGAKRRDYLLMVGGMLWAAGNMYYYAMLYLLPVLVIELFGRVDGLTQRRRDAECAEVVGRRLCVENRFQDDTCAGIYSWGPAPRPPIQQALPRSGPKNTLRTPRLCVSALKKTETLSLLLWLALLSPLQVVVLGHSANQVIGNVALMGLMAIHLVFGGNCFAAKSAKSAKI